MWRQKYPRSQFDMQEMASFVCFFHPDLPIKFQSDNGRHEPDNSRTIFSHDEFALPNWLSMMTLPPLDGGITWVSFEILPPWPHRQNFWCHYILALHRTVMNIPSIDKSHVEPLGHVYFGATRKPDTFIGVLMCADDFSGSGVPLVGHWLVIATHEDRQESQ